MSKKRQGKQRSGVGNEVNPVAESVSGESRQVESQTQKQQRKEAITKKEIFVNQRASDGISIRDIDKIKEKITIRLEVFQVILLALALIIALGIAFLAGMMFAQGGKEKKGVALLATTEIATPTRVDLEKRDVENGQGIPYKKNVTASVIPFPDVKEDLPYDSNILSSFRGPDLSMRKIKREVLACLPRENETCVIGERRALALLPLGGRVQIEQVGILQRRGLDQPQTSLPLCDTFVFSDSGACFSCYGMDAIGESQRVMVNDEKPDKKEKIKKDISARISVSSMVKESYTIQARAYKDAEKAQQYIKELVLRGYKPRIEEAKSPDGTTWFRIRIGRFSKLEDAIRYAKVFNEKEGENAIPIRLEGVER